MRPVVAFVIRRKLVSWFVLARQHSLGHDRVDDRPNAQLPTRGKDVVFGLSKQDVVPRLGALHWSVLRGLANLFRGKVGDTDVAYLPSVPVLDEFGHCILDGPLRLGRV